MAKKKAWTRAPLKSRWMSMRQRCMNPNNPGFHNYGGRGITVDPEWESYEMFAIWAFFSGYRPELELDRIDNDGPYSPDNCRWVTRQVNSCNRRTNRFVTIHGETLVEMDASKRFGVNRNTFSQRLRRGESPEEATRKPFGGAYKYFGERLTLAEAGRRFGIHWATIHYRIRKNGMSPEEAVTRPIRTMRAYERVNPHTGEILQIRAAGLR